MSTASPQASDDAKPDKQMDDWVNRLRNAALDLDVIPKDDKAFKDYAKDIDEISKVANEIETRNGWPRTKPCGCIILGGDGSFIACPKHESSKLKRLIKESVQLK